MLALPKALPAFLHSAQAAVDVGEYSREPDRLKRAGRAFDSDRDQGHFLDLADDASVLGGPKVTSLPPTRAEFERSLQAVGQDSWKAGYLPYSILESWQVLVQDFAYWKVETAAEANPAWKAHKDWFAADRERRERQILAAIGDLSHFVGDGSQPLHVTVHFNGWGDFPNPNGYSQAKLHAPFESDLVRDTVKLADVQAAMGPPRAVAGSMDQRIGGYLAATGAQVIPFYEMEKAGGLKPGDPRGKAFAVRQLGVGASELRDLIVLAWEASERQTVGWRPVAVTDVLAGKVDPYPALSGVD
ncbi:MAG: S1/P1 Nuclease [Phenylobacterium sp.]